MQPKVLKHIAGLIEFFELNNIENTEALDTMIKIISMIIYKDSKGENTEYNMKCVKKALDETLKFLEDNNVSRT